MPVPLEYPWLDSPLKQEQVQANFESVERTTRELGDFDKIHLVGATDEPAFANSWVNFAAGWAPAAFYKDVNGIVHCHGLVKNGTVGATIFTLPTGYRPLDGQIFASVSNSLIADLRVQTGGEVQMAVGSNVWLSLNTIHFRAAA